MTILEDHENALAADVRTALGSPPAESGVKPSTGKVRPMRVGDIPNVGRLFFKAFRQSDEEPDADFLAYFRATFFDCPFYDPSIGTVVHENQNGEVDAAIAVVPMRMMACGRIVTGRLMCAYMAEPGSKSGGAAKLVLTLRPRRQDLCFADTATQVSADHIHAIGGMVLPIQSLEWRRLFRPFRHGARWLERRLPVLGRLGMKHLARPLDVALRAVARRLSSRPPRWLRSVEMTDDRFVGLAPALVAHFRVHPVWSDPELRWLLAMARQNTGEGPLNLRAVESDREGTIGCYAYYGEAGAAAQVLNIFAEPGREAEVVACMMAQLDGDGFSSAAGMAQPFLIDAFDGPGAATYRHRSYFWVTTKHADVAEAIRSGDFYAGGLAGESWSRLLSDFK